MSHSADYAFAPCFAILAAFHRTLIPAIDKVPRNITSWLSEKLTIGAESFDENGLGGPAQSQEAFNPAVIQWDTGREISFISVGL
jgi:hypothetical protein